MDVATHRSLTCSRDLASAKSILDVSAHKKSFSECWLALLRIPMEVEDHKRILHYMHMNIIPHMSEPVLLVDYLADSYGAGTCSVDFVFLVSRPNHTYCLHCRRHPERVGSEWALYTHHPIQSVRHKRSHFVNGYNI
jgi:hypothetical protein